MLHRLHPLIVIQRKEDIWLYVSNAVRCLRSHLRKYTQTITRRHLAANGQTKNTYRLYARDFDLRTKLLLTT